MITGHVDEINQASKLPTDSIFFDWVGGESIDLVDAPANESTYFQDVASFGGGNGSESYEYFKDRLKCTSIDNVGICALQTMELLVLGKLDKGSVSTSAK